MEIQKVINIIKGILSSITFLGTSDAKVRLDFFFNSWDKEDDNFFESFKAVHANSDTLQELFDEKDLDFPANESEVLKQNGFLDNLTEEQAVILVDYFRSDDFERHLSSIK